MGNKKTRIKSRDIKDGSVSRADLNMQTPGRAVIASVVPGTDIEISSTGADEGTGAVTINVGADVARRNEENTFTEINAFQAITNFFANIVSNLSQAKNFANPTDNQDLATRAYVYDAMVSNNLPRINDNSNPQTFLAGRFTVPAAGDYVAIIDFRTSHDSTTNDFISNALVTRNGATETFNINRKEAKDSAGTGIIAENREDNINENTGTDQRDAVFKQIPLSGLTANQVVDVALSWNTSANGVESTIYEANIRVKRLTYTAEVL